MTLSKIALALFVIILLVLGGLFLRPKKVVAPSKVTSPSTKPIAINYLPLGDSYTIGESVPSAQRWPNQLVDRLKQNNSTWNIVANPSVTGYTTQDLIDRELPLVSKLKPDVVSVQIGVNDYVQNVPIELSHSHLIYILDTLQKQLPKPGNIFLVTIPDYAKTPSGARFGNPQAATAAINKFNQLIIQEAAARNLAVADIFPVSQTVTSQPALTARDGLHPSGQQYTLWVNVIQRALQKSSLLKTP